MGGWCCLACCTASAAAPSTATAACTTCRTESAATCSASLPSLPTCWRNCAARRWGLLGSALASPRASTFCCWLAPLGWARPRCCATSRACSPTCLLRRSTWWTRQTRSRATSVCARTRASAARAASWCPTARDRTECWWRWFRAKHRRSSSWTRLARSRRCARSAPSLSAASSPSAPRMVQTCPRCSTTTSCVVWCAASRPSRWATCRRSRSTAARRRGRSARACPPSPCSSRCSRRTGGVCTATWLQAWTCCWLRRARRAGESWRPTVERSRTTCPAQRRVRTTRPAACLSRCFRYA